MKNYFLITIMLLGLAKTIPAQKDNTIFLSPSLGLPSTVPIAYGSASRTGELISMRLDDFLQFGLALEYKNKNKKMSLGIRNYDNFYRYKILLPKDLSQYGIYYRPGGYGKYIYGSAFTIYSMIFTQSMNKVHKIRIRNRDLLYFKYHYLIGPSIIKNRGFVGKDIRHQHTWYYSIQLQRDLDRPLQPDDPVFNETITVYEISKSPYALALRTGFGLQFYHKGKERLAIDFEASIGLTSTHRSGIDYQINDLPTENYSFDAYPSYIGFTMSYPINLISWNKNKKMPSHSRNSP